MSLHEACLIGAGSSGLAALRVLRERGIPVVCFEAGSDIGGNWRYGNDNDMSSAYASLHINTSRDRMAYPGFPMPEAYPDFPHHTQVLAYFEAFAEHFGLREDIRFRHEVIHAEPSDDGWRVAWRDAEGAEHDDVFGALLVANGHHWDPLMPAFPGAFDGVTLHAHHYRTPDVLRGRRVVVVGVGNSGCDIACESARNAAHTVLSTRRGAHVVPKYILGRPLDAWASRPASFLPHRLQRTLFGGLLRLARGRQEQYGFPAPPHPVGAAHPTVSSDLLDLAGHGRLDVRPNVERLDGSRVHFEDGTSVEADVLIYATGYRVTFPFFDEALLSPRDNVVPLYEHVVAPRLPGLYFIGLIQPLGAVMPLADAQSEWVADLLAGQAGVPAADEMEAAFLREQEAMRRRYVASARHTMQVDFYPYLRRLKRVRRKGARLKANRRLPVPAPVVTTP